MRAGVIDIGSSSIKLIIGEQNEDQIKLLTTLKNVVPIGKNSFLKGRIPQGVINQTVGVLENYKNVLKEYDVSEVTVIATTAVREARNRDIFLDTVFRKTGFKVEVLNVGDVVYYIDFYLSNKLIKKAYPIREKNLLIAELGAGSLDISVLEKGYTVLNIGFPIGTLRLAQFMSHLDGSLEEVYEAIQEYIEQDILYLKTLEPKISIDDVILVDEDYSVHLQHILPNKKRESNFFQFKLNESESFISHLKNQAVEGSQEYKIPPEIAESIAGYGIIINTLFQLTKNKYIYILETSLSEAILANKLFKFEVSEKSNKTNQLISVANFLCRRYNVDEKHVKHVADLSGKLFAALKDGLGLEERDELYLLLAAYLHDIGMFINNRAHHKHAEYIISSLNLFRLTNEEIKIIACIARYHRKSGPLQTHVIYNGLSSEQQILIQKLSALLRVANALDRSHKQKVKKLEVKVLPSQDVVLEVRSNDNFILERSNFQEKKGLYEEITGNKMTLSVKNLD